MGNFYTNFTLGGVDQLAAAKELAGRSCLVTPAVNNSVVVFDSASEKQDQREIASLAEMLSQRLKCAVLAVLNHDDDILWYQLYSKGQLEDEYNSTPGYFDASQVTAPSGGDAKKLCAAFGSGNVAKVEHILSSSLEDGEYAFAFQRHEALVHALGISPYGVGLGYGYLEDGDMPDGLSSADVIRTR